MVLHKIIKAVEKLENPNHPLLGPNLKGLYFFGLWQQGSKFRNYLYNIFHVYSVLFVITQFIDLYQIRKDLQKALLNLSVTAFSVVTISKTTLFVSMQSQWMELVHIISQEEISATLKSDRNTKIIMAKYKKYSRKVTYIYWILVLMTTIITIISPCLKYVSVPDYREEIRNGSEPYPHILSSWVPLNKNKLPGFLLETVIHISMIIQGAGVVAMYDTNAVAVMAFMKGQVMIIRDKCSRIFGDDDPISKQEILKRVIECHKHHNFFIDVCDRVNSVLSPVMFIYVLVCSITICSCVVQLTLENVTSTQKLWIIEYASAQTFQLLMYCWHSNEVAFETDKIGQGIFESNWWRADCSDKKLLKLLAGKLEKPFILKAGPFTALSIPTFIDIIKGSYSFYTLLTRMQENN